MKNIGLILLLSASTIAVHAQPLEAEELLNMLECNDYNCISKLVEPKGYEVKLNNETAGYKTYQFDSKLTYQNESNGNVAKPYTVDYTVRMDDKSITISYTVGNKNQREALLADFENEGFEYVEATKTKSNFDNSAVIYKNERFPGYTLRVTNFEKKEGRVTKFMEYEFELWRPTKGNPKMIKDTVKKEENILLQDTK